MDMGPGWEDAEGRQAWRESLGRAGGAGKRSPVPEALSATPPPAPEGGYRAFRPPYDNCCNFVPVDITTWIPQSPSNITCGAATCYGMQSGEQCFDNKDPPAGHNALPSLKKLISNKPGVMFGLNWKPVAGAYGAVFAVAVVLVGVALYRSAA